MTQVSKEPYKVGDIVVSASSDSYVGEIVYISKEEDVVVHRCCKTGLISKKSYFGFYCRYMTVQERMQSDRERLSEETQAYEDSKRNENIWMVRALKAEEELREIDTVVDDLWRLISAIDKEITVYEDHLSL